MTRLCTFSGRDWEGCEDDKELLFVGFYGSNRSGTRDTSAKCQGKTTCDRIGRLRPNRYKNAVDALVTLLCVRACVSECVRVCILT